MNFAVVDLVLIGGVLLFAISWSARGFTRQSLGWLTLALGLWVAWQYEALVAALLEPWIGSMALRRIAAFLALLLLVAFGGAAVARAVGKKVSGFGGGNLDRLFGFVSGVALGGAICWGLLIGLMNFSPQIEKRGWWRESQLIPLIFNVEGQLRKQLRDLENGGGGGGESAPGQSPPSAPAPPPQLPDGGW